MSSNKDRVLQLGRELAEALDSSDIVSRWMAHHLADLIMQCEEAPHDNELAAGTREVIFKLWERKQGARFRSEPYAYMRPVLEAIGRLEPDPPAWAFYRSFDTASPSTESMATYPLLTSACEVDRDFGTLVKLAVAMASREASSLEEQWVVDGIQIADTEEDRAVRAIEQYTRRLRRLAYGDPRNLLEDDDFSGDVPPQELPDDADANTANDAADSASPDAALEVEQMDPLTLALRAAVARCQLALTKLEGLSEALIDIAHESKAQRPDQPLPEVGE